MYILTCRSIYFYFSVLLIINLLFKFNMLCRKCAQHFYLTQEQVKTKVEDCVIFFIYNNIDYTAKHKVEAIHDVIRVSAKRPIRTAYVNELFISVIVEMLH